MPILLQQGIDLTWVLLSRAIDFWTDGVIQVAAALDRYLGGGAAERSS